MSDEPQHHDLSLIPYSRGGRAVALRRGSSVVLYDERSKQITLRDGGTSGQNDVDITECPYCHRPFHGVAEEPSEDGSLSPGAENSFMMPGYFRMLQSIREDSDSSTRSSSPNGIRRPAGRSEARQPDPPEIALDASEGSTAPTPPRRISEEAFSPRYFSRFFEEKGELGRGGNGVVLLVKHIIGGVDLGNFACKRIPVGDDRTWLKKVLLEVQLLQHLSHQNVVSYKHVWLEDFQTTKFGPSVPCVFILQQYCNSGDLHRYIFGQSQSTTLEQMKQRVRSHSRGEFSPTETLQPARHMLFEEILSFFSDITAGLHYLHSNGYIHRDLKPSNCLLHLSGSRMRVLVSDFGEMQGAEITRRSTGNTGTISFCAPEVLRRDDTDGVLGNFTQKSDIFSLGLIVHLMCFAKLPYSSADVIREEDEDIDQLREEIAAWRGLDDKRKERSDLPERLYKFLKQLLSLNPEERPSTDEILQSIKAGHGVYEQKHAKSGSQVHSPNEFEAPTPPRDNSPGTTSSNPAESTRRPSIFRKQSLAMPTQPSVDGRRSPSPAYNPGVNTVDFASTQSSLLRRRTQDQTSSRGPRPDTPRLMPPPPRSRLQKFLLLLNSFEHILAWKLVVFALKFWSLSAPCSPFANQASVAYPLLCIAALDLTGIFGSAIGSLSLSLVHVIALVVVRRMDLLCQSGDRLWDPE